MGEPVKNISLRTRLLGFLLVGGLLPVLVMAVFVFLSVRAGLHAQLGQQLSISAEDARDKIDRELYERYRDLKTVADDPGLAASPADAFDRYLKTAPRKASTPSRKSVQCLALLRFDGTAALERGQCEGSVDSPRPNGLGSSDSSKVRSLPDGAPAIDLYFPLAAPTREASGVRATVDLRSLSDLLVREKLTGGLDRDVLVYTPEGRIVARKNGVAPAALSEEFPVLTGLESGFRRGGLARGREAIAAVNTLAGLTAPLDGLKWKVALIQPLDDMSEQTVRLLSQLGKGILTVAALALVTSLTGGLLLVRGILRALSRLSEAAARARDGDLTEPIEIESDDELGRLAQVFNEMTKKLKESLERLTDRANKDGLTGIANRAAFDARFADEFKRAQRYGHSLSLAILDIDHFKKFNDSYGHATGDQVLRQVARVCADSFRDTDFVARYGGEEIAFIFPVTPKKDAGIALERLRLAIEKLKLDATTAGAAPTITVSIGMANYPADAATAKSLFSFADQALYNAKQNGRNRVVLVQSGPAA